MIDYKKLVLLHAYNYCWNDVHARSLGKNIDRLIVTHMIHKTVFFSMWAQICGYVTARPVKKSNRQLNFLQNARYYKLTQVQDRKSTQPTSWRHQLQLLNEHLCQFGRHASIRYLKRHGHMIKLFLFFDFFSRV